MMKEELKKKCFRRLAFETDCHLRDMHYYLDELLDTDYDIIMQLCEEIAEVRTSFLEKIDAPLLALKYYTEGKVSWERAGEISDLGIFGLREYCRDRDVDWRELRIDKYYGFEGEEAEEKNP